MKTNFIILAVISLLLTFSCVKDLGNGSNKSSLKSFTSIKAGSEEAIKAKRDLFPTFHALTNWYAEFEVENTQNANLVHPGWLSDTWDSAKETVSDAGDAISETASEVSAGLQTYFENSSIGGLKETSDNDPKAKQRFIDYLTHEENNSYAFLDAISKNDDATIVSLLEKDTKEMKDVIGVLLSPSYEMETEDVFATMIKECKGDEFIDYFAEKFLESILIKNPIKLILSGLEAERVNYYNTLKENYTGSPENHALLKTLIESNLLDITRLRKAILGDSVSLVSNGFWDNVKSVWETNHENELSVWERIVGTACGGVSFISGWSKSLFAKDKARQTNLGGDGVGPWGKPPLRVYEEGF